MTLDSHKSAEQSNDQAGYRILDFDFIEWKQVWAECTQHSADEKILSRLYYKQKKKLILSNKKKHKSQIMTRRLTENKIGSASKINLLNLKAS